MKNWKKYLALLTALLLVLSFAACAPAEEEPTDPPAETPTAAPAEVPTEAPTEAPTEVPTEAPTAEATEEATVVSADYSAYMGQWHSGAVTMKIEKDNKWAMEENGEVFLMGTLVVNEEDGSILLYDVEGTETAKLMLESESSLYAELYTEGLYNRISDFFFTREKTSADIGVEIEDAPAEEIVPGESVEENTETEPAINEE